MHNFGFKVVDKNPHTLGPILDYAIAHKRPVEMGLYFGEPDALELLERRLFDTSIPVNAHTNHEHYHAFNLHETQDQLADHIRLARALGSAYSVLHTSYMPMTPRPERRGALLGRLLDNLERAEALCERLDYRLHLENVFHGMGFYRDLFEGIHKRGLTRIHFCFDVGHAKIWSGETLDEWLDFIDDLAEAGFGLHCHLHANQGLDDDHLALATAQALGIDGDDGYYNPYGYPEAFWRIQQRFPGAVKVFEVPAEQAIANLEAVVAARPLL